MASITANAVVSLNCGCRDWDEWDNAAQAWIHKSYRCYRHKAA